MAEADIAIVRIAPETSFKNKAYEALKEAILKMDIYATPEQVMLDERALSERLGVSRTPIREAIAMLEQDGFVKTVPRRGIVVVRRTKTEIVDMIRAWAALESMAARLITTTARKKDISALRDFFKDFNAEHMAIIEALEARDTELAEKRARDHTLGLAAYVEAHGQELFT